LYGRRLVDQIPLKLEATIFCLHLYDKAILPSRTKGSTKGSTCKQYATIVVARPINLYDFVSNHKVAKWGGVFKKNLKNLKGYIFNGIIEKLTLKDVNAVLLFLHCQQYRSLEQRYEET
jgi:hypothetical protein